MSAVVGGAGDAASVAVENAEVVAVAVGDDPVADGELGGVVAPDGGAELAVGDEVVAGPVVEVGDVAAVGGDHHGVASLRGGGVPVGHEGCSDGVGVVADGQACRSGGGWRGRGRRRWPGARRGRPVRWGRAGGGSR